MFDIGWTELFLIAAVALVVLGPNELPVVMRKLGRWAGVLRRQAAAWQVQMESMAVDPAETQMGKKPDVVPQTKIADSEGAKHD